MAVNVTPLGSVPLSPTVGVGLPVVVTVKLLLWPTVKTIVLALVMFGAVPVTVMDTVAGLLVTLPLLTVNVKLSAPT